MKYSLSNIIKDLLAKIPVLENRINTLSTKITVLSQNGEMLGTETQARIDADKAISNTISNETKARQDADKALSNQIDSLKSSLTDLQSALNTEVSNRQAADKALQSNIDSETSARKAADAAEANARKQAISDLQAQINSKYDELYKGLKSRLDGNEFVKSKNGENNIALKYEQKDGEDKKTLHTYVDGVEVPLASQNGGSKGIEEVDFDSKILTFEPIFQYSDLNSWDGKVAKNALVKATGEIQISYAEHSGIRVNYNNKYGTLLLGKIPLIDIDKAATISGGYQSELIHVDNSQELSRLTEAALSYIREHLDDFKAKAFNAIPESRNAIEFKIMPPRYIQMEGIGQIAIDISIPMGNGLAGSSGHVYIGDKIFEYDSKWTSISYIEDYLRNEYLPEHNLKGAFYSGVIIGRSDGGDPSISGFVMRE